MARPTDWYVLDMDGDPTPGDPDRVRQLASRFHDFAEHAHRAKLAVDSLQGDGAVLTWIGKSGDAFREQFGAFPDQVNKLYRSHLMVGDALETFAPVLESAQAQADRALADGRVAADKLKSLQGSLSLAETDFTGAAQAADRARAQTQAPDPEQVKQAVRDSEAAQQKRDQARSAVSGAQGELDLAKQLADQAKQLRDGAARTCAREIDDASDAGIQPRSFWAKLAEAFKELWDIICEVAKWVALVAGIIAMIIGGPLAWVALAAGAILLIKAVVDFAQGKGSVMDLVFGILGVIPGVKGLTSLTKLSALYKAGGLKEIGKAALTGMKTMANDMVNIVKQAGVGAVTVVKNLGGLATLGAAKLSDLFHVKVPPVPKDVSRSINIRECVTDPIDVATGEMVLSEIDLELPGPLPFRLERTHLSSYRGGGLFGASWASTLDQRIETDSKATLFFAADAMVLVYPIGAPGAAVLPEEGPRWPLTIAADGSARLDTGTQVLGFTAEGRLATVADPAGDLLRVERDGDGVPRALHHPSGRRVVFTAADGRITGITLAAAGSGRRTAIAAFGYDGDGHLTTVRNISGEPATFRYDHEHRITQWIDRTGYGYRYTYDEDGRCVGTVGEDGYLSATLAYEPGGTTWTDSLGHTTAYTFDEYHHKTSVTDPLGNTTRYVWGRHNQLLSETDPLGHTTSYAYDEQGRPTTVDRPGVAPTLDLGRLRGGRPRNPERVEALAGWVATTADGETISYDPEGYPIERAGAAGGVWRGEYGPFGILLATVDAEGLRTGYTYDTELRVTSVTDPRGLVWRYVHDPAGRLVAETDFNGRTRTFTYDAAGRLTATTNGLGETVDYVRDPVGNLLERRTPTGTTTYRYDTEGHLIAATGDDAELTFVWDGAGRRIAETVNGRTVRLDLDETTGTITRHTPAGVTGAWTLDPFGRPYALRSGGHELTVAHDARGREIHRAVDGRPVLAQRHDDGDRLLEQDMPGVGIRAFEHRGDGVLSAITDGTGRREYGLDRTGRVTSAGDETYHYPQGRLDGEYDGTDLLAGNGVTATYDGHGRMLTRTVEGCGSWVFTWNADDQMVAARTPAGAVWQYRYDPLGRRISKQSGAERYDFAWSGSSLVEQAHVGADGTLRVTTWDHHPADGRPVARTVRVGADLDYATVVTDRVGTPTELLGADGALRWQNTATLWGATGAPAAAQPLAFPGQYRDDETGLHYNVYRYYDPLTGRYLSQDPLGLAPAVDPAAYAANPLLWADPLGLMCTGPGSTAGLNIPKGLSPTDIAAMMDTAGDISLINTFKQPLEVIPDLKLNQSKPQWLFHGSDVPPDKIFKEGLVSNAVYNKAGSHYDIKLHQQNSSKVRDGGTYSGFVSTTEDWNTALQFVRDKDISFQLQKLDPTGVDFVKNVGGKDFKMHFGYVYVVKADSQPFVELNVQAINDISKISQKEFAALDHIPGFNISHAFKIDTPYNVGIKNGVQQLDIPPGNFQMEQFDNPGFAR
ncbi:DUF6531 domain-containing protein [Actinoplanes palleronii]|uniref:RHS repeat-associated protein n=1 Tax=Actinoplanes palleronii TaxID=113570 RepID=A0ABQ4BKF1_9ACTN|nr:DUF6531 domain-containing protein [Actinoplanes palleronii]GIE71149.1 hypothetical protein Apa02nite_072570 [Actinoplanes palleronii]